MKTTYGYGRKRETEVECNNCGVTEVVEDTNYSAVNEELRDCGWVVRKVYDEWGDFCCFDCYKEYLRRGGK